MKRLIKFCLLPSAFCLFFAGCSTPPPDGVITRTTTIFGVHIKAWDGNAPVVDFGLIRNEDVRVNSNAVLGANLLKATDYEDDGFFKGNRAHTVMSIGPAAVIQPSAAMQMPTARGSNTSWQPATLPH